MRWRALALAAVGTTSLAVVTAMLPAAGATPLGEPLSTTPAMPAPPASAARPGACVDDVRHHPGIGHACRNADGTFSLSIGGHIFRTHGYDVLPSRTQWAAAKPSGGPRRPKASPSPTETAPEIRAGSCAPDGAKRVQVVHVLASDSVDQYETRKSMIQQLFADADAKLNTEALEFGSGAHFRVACASDGTVDVLNVRLAHTEAELSASGPDLVVHDMYALGHSRADTKYWMWLPWGLDGGSEGGIAMHCSDETALPQNCSNGSQPFYAMTWGTRSDIFLHEAGHTLGAVNPGAPHVAFGSHCYDEFDIMCVYDGVHPVVCTTEHFDCGHDDYFHPYAPNGSYLAHNWNIGACFNGYLVNEGCGTSGTPPAANAGPDVLCLRGQYCRTAGGVSTDADSDLAYSYWAPATCPGTPCPPATVARLPGSPSSTTEFFGFTPSTSGTWVIDLVVHDRRGNVGRDSVTVTVP